MTKPHSHRLVRLEDLVSSDVAHPMGAMVSMTFTEATIVTSDFLVDQAGGLPLNSFLLAYAPTVEDSPLNEVVLLRVEGIATLSVQRDFAAVREDLALTGREAPMDPRTQASLESLGINCRVMGTFHSTPAGPRFGADLNRVKGNASYRVVKPHGRALSLIASYARNPEEGVALPLGVVRYAETQEVPDYDAKVFVDLKDFLGKKTGLLGMSRTGKSNSMKIVCQKTFEYGKVTGKPIGQLIFDPQGEYANATRQDVSLDQDPSALANIGNDDEVRIYKMLRNNEHETGKIKHLQLNLLAEENVEFMWSLMLRNLSSGVSAGTNYIASLESMKFYRPASSSSAEKKELWDRQLLGVYGLIGAALSDTHALPRPLTIELIGMAQDVANLIDHLEATPDGQAIKIENTDDAHAFLEYLINNEGRLDSQWKRELKKGILAPFVEQLNALKEGRNGVIAALRRTMPFHNERATGDVREKIWQDMRAGRLVMVDLSKGSPRTVTSLSELIVTYLVGKSSENFTNGLPNVPYQIAVEEAHNLFGDTSGEEMTPWVRLSKEGAKYDIGLIYATQEVTGVDHRILSNTANFIVSHLSSTIETNALSKYYGFSAWAEHLMRVEAKGFVRLKTESSPYIVPVQIDKFEVILESAEKATPAEKVEAAPDEPVEPSTSAYGEADYDAIF